MVISRHSVCYLFLSHFTYSYKVRIFNSFAEQRNPQGLPLSDQTGSPGESDTGSPISSRIHRAALLVTSAGIWSHSFGARVEQAYQLLSSPELGLTIQYFYSYLLSLYLFLIYTSIIKQIPFSDLNQSIKIICYLLNFSYDSEEI